jgi:hypothetical protein
LLTLENIMTLQDLLNEATQLSLKEKLQLATQLLQLIDCQIVNDDQTSKTANFTSMDIEEGSIGYLMSHPIPVQDFKPLRRDEIYERC